LNPTTWELEAIEQLVSLAAQNRRQADRIVAALRTYARERRGDVKKLRGGEDEWRLRVGDWRVVFQLDGDVVHVLSVLLRRDAYD
jgi:mRNA interferase RelE/StbE